ncbi:hypothetical protein GLAREA_10059 [Glarea lozoyensis ATCC 20868]|uniref:Uncharacterized protein n=1 Tax=Glarea lozoyensis (strain ATCC 20868 / MF5171) TaxID=1116229 RepID=S3D9G8_GLAL2|nr:uncharacterized protein GLAREA_10059 [Glarea lozoyensis ATCC 20868]EPE34365.1 hypothetical protein GLAREA_10059 [Glarea lozoyensis ATCC 20868]
MPQHTIQIILLIALQSALISCFPTNFNIISHNDPTTLQLASREVITPETPNHISVPFIIAAALVIIAALAVLGIAFLCVRARVLKGLERKGVR